MHMHIDEELIKSLSVSDASSGFKINHLHFKLIILFLLFTKRQLFKTSFSFFYT